MQTKDTLYICERCGNIIKMVHSSGVSVMCCGEKMKKLEPAPQEACPLKPVDFSSNEDYVVCKCNNVTCFDILDAIHKHTDIHNLLDVFEAVKNTTHCSSNCGGCYEKVIAIISEAMSN